VLCFNGTRDPLCTPALMERALTTVTAPWQMEWVDGADHSFHVLKSSGRTDAGVMAGIATVSRAWADRIPA
jgi:predicted alpha/beta-hydrolase family hydrolase